MTGRPSKQGWVLVPREPTRPMLEAMCQRRGIDPERRSLDVLDHLTVSLLADSVADYRAMVDAVSPTPDILETLRAVRAEFRVEQTDEGRHGGISYLSDALPRVVSLLDDAIAKAEASR